MVGLNIDSGPEKRVIQLLPSSTVPAGVKPNGGVELLASGTPAGTPIAPPSMHPGAFAPGVVPVQTIGAISGGTREPLQYWCTTPEPEPGVPGDGNWFPLPR